MRNDLNDFCTPLFHTLCTEILELRAVVDPLIQLASCVTGVYIWKNVRWHACKIKEPDLLCGGDTLSEALFALLAALKPPEPKWSVNIVETTRSTVKDKTEKDAFEEAASIDGTAVVRRDGRAVCVFIGGERFNKEERQL